VLTQSAIASGIINHLSAASTFIAWRLSWEFAMPLIQCKLGSSGINALNVLQL